MKTKGFTLIELLVVIVIIGLLAGIAVFSYRDLFARSRLEETMNEVRAFYEGVNKKAVTEGSRYIIRIDREDDLLGYISADVSRNGELVLREGLDLDFDGGTNPIELIVHVDGFVRAENNVRDFSVEDDETGKLITFYISPLGVMEARLQ